MIVHTKNGLERRAHLVTIHRGLIRTLDPVLAEHEEAFENLAGEVVIVDMGQRPVYSQFDLPDMRLEHQLKEWER